MGMEMQNLNTSDKDGSSIGELNMKLAYANGVYSGTGVDNEGPNDNSSVLDVHALGLLPIYTIPHDSHSLESKVKWLAGLIDSSASVVRNDFNRDSIIIRSANEDFLNGVSKVLSDMDITGNAIEKKTNENGLTSHYLRVDVEGVQLLLDLGLKLHCLEVRGIRIEY